MSEYRFDHEAAIVGAGFSGIGAAIGLRRAGIEDFVILEKKAQIGGTWRDNRYPGSCCDVPSSLYSFSYALNPGWSRRFAPAAEIFAYQQRVVKDFGLAERIRGGFGLAGARYEDGGWSIRGTDGARLRVRYLIMALGTLHVPHKPHFDGLHQYRGKVMHSAEWDPAFDVDGKDVIVIGSAASAIQIVPQLARSARRLTVMQRTPNYILPRRDRRITTTERRLFARLPLLQRLYRWRQYLLNDVLFHANFVNRFSLRRSLVRWLVRRHMRRQAGDAGLLERLTPRYPPGCKRILLSDDYIPALKRSNVELVTETIESFDRHGLTLVSGRRIDADLVVLATGFETHRLLSQVEITGPDATSLQQHWAGNGMQAHRSIAVSGFPNLFLMYGPNSNLGHSSVIIMIEQQARHIARLLARASERNLPVIEARADAQEAWNRRIQKALDGTVWKTGCDSWYQDNQGRIYTLWPFTTTRFIREMRKIRTEEYEFRG